MHEVVILCGGKGTRLSEETEMKPKPMVNIGGWPILWHIMKIYSYYGFNRFVLALGYRGDMIKQYFYDYRKIRSNILLKMDPHQEPIYFNQTDEKDWEIILIDTGEHTLKGGRIKRIEKYIQSDVFHLTYGDGVCNIDLKKLLIFHKSHNCIGTVTAIRPPSRFGELRIDNKNIVGRLEEKPQMGKGFINGGFFVFNKEIFSYLTEDENCDFEFGPLQQIAKEKQLKAFKYDGFWQCMDNVRDRDYLTNLVRTNNAPWMHWR